MVLVVAAVTALAAVPNSTATTGCCQPGQAPPRVLLLPPWPWGRCRSRMSGLVLPPRGCIGVWMAQQPPTLPAAVVLLVV